MSKKSRSHRRSTLERTIPADLIGVLVLVALTNIAVFASGLNDSPLRAVFGLIYLLFLPGYALVAALFPRAPRVTGRRSEGERATHDHQNGGFSGRDGRSETVFDRGIDGIERVALSFGLSIALVPLLAIGISISPLEFGFLPVLLLINGFVIGCTLIAAVRRFRIPADTRFFIPYRRWWDSAATGLTGQESRTDALLNVGLAAAILLAVGALGGAMIMPPDGEEYTEFYIVTDDDGGEPVAADYPESLAPEEPATVNLGIENYEREAVEYEVIIQLQRIESAGNVSTVTERAEIDRFSVSLAHDESWTDERIVDVTNELTGSDLRLVFLLYADEPPATPTRENAHRDLFLWVDVDDPAE